MNNQSKITCIIGGGNMGEALIKGLHKTHKLNVVEANVDRVKYLKSKYRVTSAPLVQAVAGASVIVLAVKPQDMADVLLSFLPVRQEAGSNVSKLSFPNVSPPKADQPLADVGNLDAKLFISIAAGLTTKFFETHLGGKPKVIRSMPNMPALIGEGITGVCVGKYAKPADLKLAQSILSVMGETVVVKESMIDAVTAVSGSGPAYVFLFVEQWMAAAKKLGFKEADAKRLVYQTLIGSAHLLKQSPFSAAELRAKVTSKGGTTQAAMDVFAKCKLEKTMIEALSAASNRAKQLAK